MPQQTNYAVQSGQLSAVISSATPWPTSNGVLAEVTFVVQDTAQAQMQWPVRLSNVEITSTGYDNRFLADDTASLVINEEKPPQPKLVMSSSQEEAFEFMLEGTPGTIYRIEVSDDLIRWVFLKSIILDNGNSRLVSDPTSILSPYRFYRAVKE